MEVVKDFPPLFGEIDAAFDLTDRDVIFAWGNRIYNPGGVAISDELMAHEAVHGERQGSDIEGWWRRYIDQPMFRLREEIVAHQAEYEMLLQINGNNRRNRRRYAKHVGARLASPLYGKLISTGFATKCFQGKAFSLTPKRNTVTVTVGVAA